VSGVLAAGGETVTSELAVEMLRRMLVIREFERLLPHLYTEGLTRGSSHPAIGQEAVAVGACMALLESDLITSTHRGHGHTIAKGGDVRRMIAELLGRESGYCRGKGGSMHIADFSIGMLGANGIVGGGIGIAGGAALSASMRGSDQVVVCFIGDAALNQGAFLEVGNMAAIWRLPLVFVCENNQFAMSARPSAMVGVRDLARRADGLGFPGATIDGMNVLEVYASVHERVEAARSGEGPSLVVATCYRFEGHFAGDTLAYRPRGEAEEWFARDPLVTFRAALAESGILSEQGADELEAAARDEVAAALEEGKASPLPAPAAAWEDVVD
jgi:TPP-dependent pyruvate/acetoin dehydrogenase alpha subunit